MTDAKFALLTAAGAVAAEILPAEPPVILGAPLGMLLAAHAGALFALARTPPEQWGLLLSIPPNFVGAIRWAAIGGRAASILTTVTANAFMCAWFVAWIPHIFPSYKDAPLAAGAGFFAFGGQTLIPKVFEALGRWVDGWGGKKP